MPNWGAFAGFVGVVLGGLLLLAHASSGLLSGDADGETRASSEAPHADDAVDTYPATPTDRVVSAPSVADERLRPDLSTGALLVNVAVSQGLFGSLLVVGAWYTGVPAAAFGVDAAAVGTIPLAAGVGLGVALYAVNEAGSTASDRFGLGDGDALREALAPDSVAGWAVLLFVVLPTIAGFEELLFRGALVGAFVAGFGVSPWLLAALSSVAFALGHGAQGPGGVVVTGLLGFVLAAAFVLTGSLATVVVAHYLVNALEFVVHEGAGVAW
ncbi:MAG: lysostaphin resistance A-like protein [Haloplanus sp.]